MKIREEKNTDQEGAEKAYILLIGLIKRHQSEIEPALWVGPMICALAENYEKSDVAFENFKREITEAVHHYEY